MNDLYENLYHFWHQLQSAPEQVIKQVQEWKDTSNDGRVLFRYLTDKIDNFDEVKKAAAFFVFNRITFSGTTESGGYSNAAFEKRFTQSSIERAKLLATILNDTRITNLDYQEIVEADGDNVFIFLDPPYYSATKSALYGKNGNLHRVFNHERFADVLKNSGHKWLITYDDCEYIRNLFSFANIREWNLTYGMRNVNENLNLKGEELFISNFPFEDEVSNRQLSLFNQK